MCFDFSFFFSFLLGRNGGGVRVGHGCVSFLVHLEFYIAVADEMLPSH